MAETPSPDTKSPVFTGDNIVEFDDPEAVQAEADRAAGQDTRLNDYLGARLDECVRYRDGELMDHLRECWELYDAQPQYGRKDSPWDNASNLTVALAATYVDQFTAKHVNALRSPTPFLSLKSYLPENMEGVRALSDYINWAEQSMWKGQQLVEDFERERCKVGTGVGYVGFLDIPYRQRPDITSPAQDQGRLKTPDAKWIPREDFVITPGYDDPDKAPLVGHRSWIAKAGLQRLAIEQQIDMDWDAVKPTRRDDHDPELPLEDEVAPYEIFFVSFAYDLDDDDYPEEYEGIYHYQSRTLLHYNTNQRAFGRRPYFTAPYIRREGEFDGLGICEQIRQYQAEVTTMHNQRIDNASLANNVMLKGRPSPYLTEKTRWYPGKLWLVNDINDLAPVDLPRTYRSTIEDESITIGLAERRIGISDAGLGRESTLTNRAAATTMLALMEQGAQRDDLSVTLARNAFQRYGELLLEAFQIGGLPEPSASTSPEAILGPERGSLVRRLVGNPDSLLGIVGVTIEVSTRAVNKEMERQAQERLYGMVLSHATQVTKFMQVIYNPQTPPEVKQFFIASIQSAEKVLRRVVEDLGAYDLDSLFIGETLGTSPTQPPMTADGMMQGSENGTATGGGGGGGNSPPPYAGDTRALLGGGGAGPLLQ